MSSKFMLTDAVVFTGVDGESTLNHGAVLIDGDTIVDVGPEDQLREQWPDVATEPLGKKLLMPGLVNTHIHLNMAIFRGLAEDLPLDDWLEETYRFRKSYMDEDTQKLGVKLSLAESILSGVTTIADMSFYQDRYSPLVEESGIRAVLYDTIMAEYLDSDRPGKIRDFIGGKNEGRITRGAALHAPYSTNEELLEWFVDHVVEETDVPYAIHLDETWDEIQQFRKDKDQTPTEWLNDAGFLSDRLLAVHGVWLNELEANLLYEHNVSLSHNPESNMKLGAGIAPITKLRETGITMGLGTDSAASNNDLDLFSEMDFAGKLQKVHQRDPRALPAEQIVGMATREGAEAIGLGNQIGTIQAGKQADLITVDWNQLHLRPVYSVTSHLVYSASGHDVSDVWIGGERLVEDGSLTQVDEDALFEEINEANHRINRKRRS